MPGGMMWFKKQCIYVIWELQKLLEIIQHGTLSDRLCACMARSWALSEQAARFSIVRYTPSRASPLVRN